MAITNEIEYINLIYPDQVILLPNPDDLPTPLSQTGMEIIVKTSTQQLFAFEDGELIRDFVVSTGLPDTPTRSGDEYEIQHTYESALMSGPGYYYPGVPWIIYYDGDYGIHGTDWHSNFGQPMSHGCVNMRVEDAEWLYNWVSEDVLIRVITR